MNRLNLTDEQITEWLAACEAWAKGKDVQYFSTHDKWCDWDQGIPPLLTWTGTITAAKWRIKPEPVIVRAWVVVDESGAIECTFAGYGHAKRDAKSYAEAGPGRSLMELTGEFTP